MAPHAIVPVERIVRQMLASNAALARKLSELEKRYDENFRAVFDAIRSLMEDDQDAKERGRIGYQSESR